MTRLAALAMAAQGDGLSPYQDMPVGALGHFAPTAGFADDFVQYAGPTTASGTAGGFTLLLDDTGVLLHDLCHDNGAGVLRHTFVAAFDAVSLETANPVITLSDKAVRCATKIHYDVTATDLAFAFGLGTVGVDHAFNASDDLVDFKWDPGQDILCVRTRRGGGPVENTDSSRELNQRFRAHSGELHVGVIITATTFASVLSFDGGERWEVVGAIERTHPTAPLPGAEMGLYIATINVPPDMVIDQDYWSLWVER